ncbi:MAG: RNA polymerase sporulation sigma factor SigK [Bacillota bacterium]
MLGGLWAIMILSVTNGILLLTSYISNNTFPHPLSENEEAEYISRLNQGDEKARHVLAEHNLRLVAHIVKKFDSSGEDIDDLISIGTIGLIKAIDTYCPDRGTRLATYAARCIENEILMHLRFVKKMRSEVSLYDPIGVDKEGNEINLLDILGTHADVVSELVENKFEQYRLLGKIKNLTHRERKVLELRFGLTDGTRKTQREIAKILNISRSYVSRIEKKALIKVIKEMSTCEP